MRPFHNHLDSLFKYIKESLSLLELHKGFDFMMWTLIIPINPGKTLEEEYLIFTRLQHT